MKRSWRLGIAVVVGLWLASCDCQKYNTIRQPDLRRTDFRPGYRAGDPEVYGIHPDSAAVQSKYNYTPNPALEERTQKIRDKMFGTGTIGEGA